MGVSDLKSLILDKIFELFKFEGTEMQPQLLLMSKLILVLLVAHGFFNYIDDPFIPFVSQLDLFNEMPGLFKNILRIGFILFGILLLFNIRVRIVCIFLGIIIITAIIASKPVFRNHLFIVGCALLLAGLSDREGHPWLINIQLSLVYLGAFVNKILDSDWWNGAFMHNWLQYGRENPIYIEISSILPDYWFALLLSWIAICAELIIGALILSKRWRLFGVWIAIIFHSGLFALIGIRFTHFMDAIFIMFLAFLVWPKRQVIARYKNDTSEWFRRMIRILDWDRKIIWIKSPEIENSWLEMEYDKTYKKNEFALRSLLLYSTGFYVLLFILNLIFVFLIDHRFISYAFSMFFLWGFIIFFLPINWTNVFKRMK